MSDKKLVLILNAGCDYIRHTGGDETKYAAELGWIFEMVSETCLPLLGMMESLERDAVPFQFGLVISPVLCTLLEDPAVQEQYERWLDCRIEVGRREIERCRNDAALLSAAKLCLERHQESKLAFQRCGRKILRKFAEYQKKGFLELLATCATDVFLPHYSDMEEILNAQVETGLHAYKAHFGEAPEGFWLPELGYSDGVERVLRGYGVNYTVLDARSFLLSETEPAAGIFCPARFENSLVAFGRDAESDEELFGAGGFARRGVYLDRNRDIGFALPQDELAPFLEAGSSRRALGYRYWSKGAASGSGADGVYDAASAAVQCASDAEGFLLSKIKKLSAAERLLPEQEELSLVVTVDLNRLRTQWAEGIFFIESCFRTAVGKPVSFEKCRNLIENQFALQKIRPCYGSAAGDGYGENLLSHKNNWMMRYVRKACGRMVDLAGRFPSDTGLKARLL
ncbi:MAG: hypothetical protein K2H09_00365, partial [Treponemataceae bacterium]|nr:hypothetical protein [Treponemataceae bacterium]